MLGECYFARWGTESDVIVQDLPDERKVWLECMLRLFVLADHRDRTRALVAQVGKGGLVLGGESGKGKDRGSDATVLLAREPTERSAPTGKNMATAQRSRKDRRPHHGGTIRPHHLRQLRGGVLWGLVGMNEVRSSSCSPATGAAVSVA